MRVLEFNSRLHMDGLRACAIELQDAEREFEPRMPTGEEIADAYIPEMFSRCESSDGRVFVAEIDGEVVGYATILSRVTSEEISDGGLEYGLIADLVTLSAYRKQGVAHALLDAAETFARERGTKWLRIGALAANQLALDIYDARGFSKLYVELEKELGHAGA